MVVEIKTGRFAGKGTKAREKERGHGVDGHSRGNKAKIVTRNELASGEWNRARGPSSDAFFRLRILSFSNAADIV